MNFRPQARRCAQIPHNSNFTGQLTAKELNFVFHNKECEFCEGGTSIKETARCYKAFCDQWRQHETKTYHGFQCDSIRQFFILS